MLELRIHSQLGMFWAWAQAILAIGIACLIVATAAGQGADSGLVADANANFQDPQESIEQVDYVAALNRHLSQGVTPETNAFVPICLTLGPERLPALRDPTYLELLGITPADVEQAETLVAWEILQNAEGVVDRDQLSQLFSEAQRNAWSPADFPLGAKWVGVNARQLATIIAALDRPHFYRPLTPEDAMDGITLVTATDELLHSPEIAYLLQIRGFLHAGKGDFDAAWRDFLAIRKLCRHLGYGSSMLHARARGLETIAASSSNILLMPNLSADRIHQFRGQFLGLPQRPSRYMLLDSFDRVELLSQLQYYSRQASPKLFGGPRLGQNEESRQAAELAAQLVQFGGDWEAARAEVNEWFDKLVAIGAIEDFAERDSALKRLEDDLKRELQKVSALSAQDSTPQARGVVIGFCLFAARAQALISSCSLDRLDAQRDQLFEVSLAIGHFAHEHEMSLPQSLADLVPDYVNEVPVDFFSGRPLAYRIVDDGAVLYSVGPNGTDDGGELGDIAVRVQR